MYTHILNHSSPLPRLSPQGQVARVKQAEGTQGPLGGPYSPGRRCTRAPGRVCQPRGVISVHQILLVKCDMGLEVSMHYNSTQKKKNSLGGCTIDGTLTLAEAAGTRPSLSKSSNNTFPVNMHWPKISFVSVIDNHIFSR